MKNCDYDIIIVGAGPAGLSAGYYASKKGANVLVLDKKPVLGVPIRCGEATVETIFKDFDIKPTKEIISNKVNCLKLYSSKGKTVELKIDLYGYILNREKFEQYLGQKAECAGAEIILNTTVIGLKNSTLKITDDNGKTSRSISGKVIIGADGVESRVGRWAGIDTTLKPEDIAVCQQYVIENIDLDPDAVEFYWGSKYSPHAYVWLFPKSNNSANVGIVSFGSLNIDLSKNLEKFIKIRAPNGTKVRFIAGCVPQAEPLTQVVKDNVMLIGDAARVALPVTGAGIGHALRTGMWAGELAGVVIKNDLGNIGLLEYEKKMNIIRRKLKRSYKLKQKVLKDDHFYELLFAIAKPIPFIYKNWSELFNKYFLKSIRY